MGRIVSREVLPLVFILTTFVVLGGAVIAITEFTGDNGPGESILEEPNLNQGEISGIAGEEAGPAALGEVSGLGGINTTIEGGVANGTAGYDIAAGDVNGDGYRDIVIAAPAAASTADPRAERPNDGTGAVYVFYGPIEDTKLTTDAADVTITGPAGAGVGWSIAVGNLTDEDRTDIVIGAPFHDGPNGAEDVGAVFVVSGDQLTDGTVDLSTDANATYYGVDSGARAGHDVATVPAYGTDGVKALDRANSIALSSRGGTDVDSLLVGAPYARPNGAATGAAYLITAVDSGTERLDDAADRTYAGVAEGDAAGWAVAAAPVDDDRYRIVVIGAPFSDSNGTDSGAAYVLSAPPASSGATAGSGSESVSVDTGWTLEGIAPGDAAGYSAASVGTVLERGNSPRATTPGPDIAIGAPFNDEDEPDGGAVYILDTVGRSGSLSLDDANATVTGSEGNERAGWSVAGGYSLVGGDTQRCSPYDDLVIGAPFDDENGPESGSAHVLTGGQYSTSEVDDAAANLSGGSAADRAGWAVASVGDVTGDGTADLVVGAPFVDAGANNSGSVYLISSNCEVQKDRPLPPVPTDAGDSDRDRDTRDDNDRDRSDRRDRDKDDSDDSRDRSDDAAATQTPVTSTTTTAAPTTSTPNATETPNATSTPNATETPNATTVTVTSTPTATATPTAAPTPTATQTATATPTTTTATATSTATPAVTSTETPASTATETATATATTTTAEPTSTATATAAPTATQTATATATSAATATRTATATSTATPSAAAIETPTTTAQATATEAPTTTAQATATDAPTTAAQATDTQTSTESPETETETPGTESSLEAAVATAAASTLIGQVSTAASPEREQQTTESTPTQPPTSTPARTAPQTTTAESTQTQAVTAAAKQTRSPTGTATATPTQTQTGSRTATGTATSAQPPTTAATQTQTRTQRADQTPSTAAAQSTTETGPLGPATADRRSPSQASEGPSTARGQSPNAGATKPGSNTGSGPARTQGRPAEEDSVEATASGTAEPSGNSNSTANGNSETKNPSDETGNAQTNESPKTEQAKGKPSKSGGGPPSNAGPATKGQPSTSDGPTATERSSEKRGANEARGNRGQSNGNGRSDAPGQRNTGRGN